ncbi:MAG: hypothetical protein ACRELY_19985 [Polyangiaceae bacterium]
MNADVKKTVRNTCIFSASVAVVLSPIPLADELVLIPTYGVLATRIAKHHDLAARSLPWKDMMKTTAAALVARAAVNLSVAYIPGVAAVANATSAVFLTTLIGDYIDAICTDPTAPRALSVQEIAARFRAKAQRESPAPAS